MSATKEQLLYLNGFAKTIKPLFLTTKTPT